MALGLFADAGYLAGPVGLATNVPVAIVKALYKSVPNETAFALRRVGPTVWRSSAALARYAARALAKHGGAPRKALQDMADQFRRVIASRLGLTNTDLADTMRLVDARVDKFLSDDAFEGIAAYGARNTDGFTRLDDLHTTIRSSSGGLQEVADDSLESIGEAVGKAYKRNLPGSPDADPAGFDRVGEAVAAARAGGFSGPARFEVELRVGQGAAIQSMEEFEALRFMRAEDLRPEQVTAINQIAQVIGVPMTGSRLGKVLPLNEAIAKAQTGDADLAGFFARLEDVPSGASTPELIDRLRLDRSATPFLPGSPHAIIETRMSATMHENAKIPRSPGYGNGHADEFVDHSLVYPNTGNGFAASRDGHLTPEYSMAATTMDAGLSKIDGLPITTMKFRFDDGTPYPQTIGGVTASDWKLIPDPSSPSGFRWAPL